MMRFFLLFTLVPAFDLWLLVRLGGEIGGWNTVLLTLFISLTGAALARQEGAAVLRQLSEDAARGLSPSGKLLEAAMVFAGGLLLVAPGLITDTVGLMCLFPPTRRLIAPLVSTWFAGRVAAGGWSVNLGQDASPPPQAPPQQEQQQHRRDKHFDHPVA